MTTSHAAMKKDLDVVEQRLTNYVPLHKFTDLQHQCLEYALQTELEKIDKNMEKNIESQSRFAVKNDVNERFNKIEKELWTELALKIEKRTVH